MRTGVSASWRRGRLPRRRDITVLVLAAAFALLGASSAQAASLTTKFDSNNIRHGNTFDLVVKPASGITVTSLDLNLDAAGGTSRYEVWTHATTSVGFETSTAGWTFQGEAAVPAAGTDVPSPAPISFFLPQGSYGVVILTRNCAIIGCMRYTNGGPTVVEDANLKLTTRKGVNDQFFTAGAELNDPREWNGTIRYKRGSGKGVALFNDDAYVDAATDPPGGEVKNLEASLKAKGHPVTKFSLLSAAALNRVLARKDVLLIPELESGQLAPDLGAGARSAIHDFVTSGRGLVMNGDAVFGRTATFLNSLFGFVLTESNVAFGPDMPRKNAAATTEFAGGPGSLEMNNGTAALSHSSLPTGAKRVYGDDERSAVVQFRRGAGSITYLGWDWFNSVGQDGGWQTVLHRAVNRFLKLLKPKLNRRRGTAKLPAKVSGPGKLILSGKGIRRDRARSTRPGKVALAVKPNAKTKGILADKGAAKVKAKVKYRPVGGSARKKGKRVRLVKR